MLWFQECNRGSSICSSKEFISATKFGTEYDNWFEQLETIIEEAICDSSRVQIVCRKCYWLVLAQVVGIRFQVRMYGTMKMVSWPTRRGLLIVRKCMIYFIFE